MKATRKLELLVDIDRPVESAEYCIIAIMNEQLPDPRLRLRHLKTLQNWLDETIEATDNIIKNQERGGDSDANDVSCDPEQPSNGAGKRDRRDADDDTAR